MKLVNIIMIIGKNKESPKNPWILGAFFVLRLRSRCEFFSCLFLTNVLATLRRHFYLS